MRKNYPVFAKELEACQPISQWTILSQPTLLLFPSFIWIKTTCFHSLALCEAKLRLGHPAKQSWMTFKIPEFPNAATAECVKVHKQISFCVPLYVSIKIQKFWKVCVRASIVPYHTKLTPGCPDGFVLDHNAFIWLRLFGLSVLIRIIVQGFLLVILVQNFILWNNKTVIL